MRGCLAFVMIAALALVFVAFVAGGEAYIKFGLQIDGRNVVVRWPQMPVRYFVSDRGVDGVTSAQLDDAVRRASAAWQGLSSARVSFERVGFTSALPSGDDTLSVIGFESRQDMDRVLGATSYTFDALRGQIVEADIYFNAVQPWSVATAGQSGRFDLESVALHELGHILGLGHSAIGETEMLPSGRRRLLAAGAVMFPIAFPPGSLEGRSLRADDMAGASDLYPAESFQRETGSISGRVTKSGQGVFGAHIVVFNLRSRRLVGGYALERSGEFVVGGLDPGPSIVRVEPLDDGDLESFFEPAAQVDVNFRVAYSERVVIVPRGGNADRVEIAVQPK